MPEIDDKALEAAVLAYDEARRTSYGRTEPAMSLRNRETIAPMIAAAILAYESAKAARAGFASCHSGTVFPASPVLPAMGEGES